MKWQVKAQALESDGPKFKSQVCPWGAGRAWRSHLRRLVPSDKMDLMLLGMFWELNKIMYLRHLAFIFHTTSVKQIMVFIHRYYSLINPCWHGADLSSRVWSFVSSKAYTSETEWQSAARGHAMCQDLSATLSPAFIERLLYAMCFPKYCRRSKEQTRQTLLLS